MSLSRREFVRSASATALGAVASAATASAQIATGDSASASTSARSFPKDFLWGTATAAYQVEGAVNEDGRGKSIWDTYSHTPGKIKMDGNGDVADDHYHRYKEDVALMKALGAKCYRFSIAWPRVIPNGSGTANPKGFDFYNRLVDELLTNGIAPFATLFHWDLPQALQDNGNGWENPDTAKAFGDYAALVAEKISDRVKHFFTINEYSSFIDGGYGWGHMAPGLKLEKNRLNQTRHNALIAHGLAVQAIRAQGKSDVKVGIAENSNVCVPVIETAENIRAAEIGTRETNARYLTAIMEGKYTDAYLKECGPDAPKFTEAEMKTISSPLDFVGINIYGGRYVRASDEPAGFTQIDAPDVFPKMATSTWLRIVPESLYWGTRNLAKVWSVKEIYVTENGCCGGDVATVSGAIDDVDRVMFLRNYLTHLQRATAEGVPVRGYFLWSLLDNFEWGEGLTTRFGIHYVNYNTQQRTPKLSAEFYKNVIARNAVV